MNRQQSVEDRFWAKVHKTDLCWLWRGTKVSGGYGHFWDGSGPVKAYRFAYELLVGPIPDGLVIDHLCRNPSCVNPEHLEPVTQGENTRRGFTGIATARRERAKTCCPHGHPYDEANTIVRKNGWRTCRTCKRTKDQSDYLERVGAYQRRNHLRII